jgi:hypothetical protein
LTKLAGEVVAPEVSESAPPQPAAINAVSNEVQTAM